MIKEIKLDGNVITKISAATVQVETPSDDKGLYREKTFAATITVERDASDAPNAQGFKLATNEDGRKKIIAGSIELVNGEDQQAFSFDIKRAFVSRWILHNPSDPSAPTTETIELRVGEIEVNAGGSGAKFNLPYFK